MLTEQTDESSLNPGNATGGSGGLLMSAGASRRQSLVRWLGEGLLLTVASASAFAVLFIFYFITKDAYPFFQLRGFREFFTSTHWYPSASPAEFGVLAIFFGSAMVTVGSSLVAVPLGVTAAICLSDVLPFQIRQLVKPVIEMLAAIPSVAFGFFALVVFAPLLQEHGGSLLGAGVWCVGAPIVFLLAFVCGDMFGARKQGPGRAVFHAVGFVVVALGGGWFLHQAAQVAGRVEISSGTNALNVSIILGIMALPTVVSVSEDALQAVSRDIREGSYALGATRAETLLLVVLPAASSGICAAVILGVMRALGETMVVWMASGNSARIPSPWFNVFEPIRTLTATIAGDMGEADHVTGSARFHVLFAMAFCLLVFSFALNLVSEWAIKQAARKTGKLS